jgi:hypothetical protein
LVHRTAGLAIGVLGALDGGVAIVVRGAGQAGWYADAVGRALFSVGTSVAGDRVARDAAVFIRLAGCSIVAAAFAVVVFRAVVQQAYAFVAPAAWPGCGASRCAGGGLGVDGVVAASGETEHRDNENAKGGDPISDIHVNFLQSGNGARAK